MEGRDGSLDLLDCGFLFGGMVDSIKRTLLSHHVALDVAPARTFPRMREGGASAKSLKMLAPRAGFEPATNRLTAGCSTTELPGNRGSHVSGAAYSKPVSALQ